MAGGVNEAREEDGVYEGQKGTLEAGKRLDLLEVIGRIVARLYLPIFFFHSTTIYRVPALCLAEL